MTPPATSGPARTTDGGPAAPYDTTLVVRVDEPDLVPDRRVPGEPATLRATLQVTASDGADGDAADPRALAVALALDLGQERRPELVRAVREALPALPAGARFAVLAAGPGRYYPDAGQGAWAPADRDHRRAAVFALGAAPLAPAATPRTTGYDGWLAAARELFAGCERPLRRLLLVTDGSATRADALDRELDACGAEFGCEVIAVGDRWDYRPLDRIATRLRGTAEAAGPDFAPTLAAAVRRACRRAVPELPLEIRTRPGVELDSLVQFTPEHRRLDPHPAHPHHHRFAALPWDPSGAPSEFLLTLRADDTADVLGEELQFATVSLGDLHAAVTARWLAPGPPPARTAAHTPEDTTADSRILDSRHRMVDHLQKGLEALDAGRRTDAEEHLGRAAAAAHRLGEDWVLDEIRAHARIIDAATGRTEARLPADPHRIGVTLLHLSTRSAGRGPRRPHPGGATPTGPCPDPACAEPAVPGARYCVRCGRRLA
ncbi:hypothetical protein ACFW9D_27210 [Streptomyces sp. NPDC059524]|uniref:hypothetical protein n=1 Tax=Streptomyces sp. NPDC059524 TaxID=3346856 RepID=UPI0036CB8648